MTSDEKLKLVEDALRFRKSTSTNSCFVWNEALSQLRNLDQSVLPVIELVIHDIVVPVMNEHSITYGTVKPNLMFRDGPPLLGLSDVLGVYWLIAEKSNPNRAVAFMRATPWAVESESILALVRQYNPNRSDVIRDLPATYRDYILSLYHNQSSEILEMASYAIQKLKIEAD